MPPSRQLLHSRQTLILAFASGFASLLVSCSESGGSQSQAPPASPSGPPELVVDLDDGTARDLAASTTTTWVAQGRRLGALDATTLERLPALETTYSTPVRAVELASDGTLYVLDDTRLYRRASESAPEEIAWTAEAGAMLRDVGLAGEWVLVLGTDEVFALAPSPAGTGELEQRAEVELPAEFLYGATVSAFESAGGTPRAVVIGQVMDHARMVYAFAVLDLDPDQGPLGPTFGPVWMPDPASQPFAEVSDVLPMPDPGNGRDLLWVAAGKRSEPSQPYVEVLEVNEADEPYSHVAWVEFPAPFELADQGALHFARNGAGTHVLLATDRSLTKIDAASLAPVGTTSAEFQGERIQMVTVPYPLGERLWAHVHNSQEYPLRTFDITGDDPALLENGWWLVGCDAAVHVPEWRSLYLTTFSGLVRYDVSDPAAPVVAGGHFASAGGMSYQPGTSSTEDADFLDAGEQSAILVARGNGGFDAFPVSAAAPDPGPPATYPSSVATPFYCNDIEAWTAPDGTDYALTDITVEAPSGLPADRVFQMEAARHDPASGTFTWTAVTGPVTPPSAAAKPMTHVITTSEDFAFVGTVGGFFIVDMRGLPSTLEVTDVVSIAVGGDEERSAHGLVRKGNLLYVATRGVVSSLDAYAFDPATGTVDPTPVSVLDTSDPGVPADFQLVNRIRLSKNGATLLAAGSLGRLFAIDVSTPTEPAFISAWQSPGGGHTSDCRTSMFALPEGGEREHVVFVTVSEAFKLLALDP